MTSATRDKLYHSVGWELITKREWLRGTTNEEGNKTLVAAFAG
jgi:hypothetical protein